MDSRPDIGTVGSTRGRPGGPTLVRLVLGTAQQAVTVEVADTYLRRLRGMLGRAVLPEALLLVPGGGVHGVGMRVPLDVAMLTRVGPGQRSRSRGPSATGRYRIVKVALLRPFGLVSAPRGTCAVLEAPAGSLRRWAVGPGTEIELDPQT